MSDARVVFRNTSVLAAARIIERVTGLVLALVITRHLGAAGLGVYSTALAYFGLIALAAQSGTEQLLIRELSKDPKRTSSYVVHTSVMAVTFSAVVMGIALLVIPHLGYAADLRQSLELIVLAVLPGTLNTIQEATFVAHGRVELETLTTFASSVVLVGASVGLLATGHGVVSLVLTFVLLEYAVTAVYFLLIMRYITPLKFAFKWPIATEILHEMKSFAGLSIVAGVFARPEILILSLFVTPAQLGYYSGAAKIVDVFQFLPQVYMTNIYPLLSRSFHRRDGRAQKIQDIATRHLLLTALPISVGLFVEADRIIAAFYGDEFGSAVTILRILSLYVILFNLQAMLWRVLAARGEQARVLRIQLVTTAARLAIATALIAMFEDIGAAVAVPVSTLIYVVLLAHAVRTDGTKLPLLQLSWRFLAATGVLGMVIYALNQTVALWAIIPVAAAVYVSLLLLFRAFSPDEVAHFKALLPLGPLRSGRPG